MIPEQISHPTERKLHCCNNHSNEQPIQSEYHRDSAASDKDRSQTQKVANRRLCCHNHQSPSHSNNDRPVSGQQPNRQYPKIMPIKPLSKTGTAQPETVSKVGRVFWSISRRDRGKPLSRLEALPDNKRRPATFPKKQSQTPSRAGEQG
jgi:hypothetical protein